MNKKKNFFKTAEGFVFILGIVVFISGFFILYPVIQVNWKGMLMMLITGIAGGKGVSIPVGLGKSLPEWLVFVVAALQDIVAVFWFYPFIVLFKNKVIKGKLIGNIVQNAQDTVDKHKNWLKPFGVLGIGFFVWIPLTMTGPIVGSVFGLLLGMSTPAIMITVTVAGVLSALCWTYLFDFMFTWASNVNKYFPAIAVIVILALLLIIRLEEIYRKRKYGETE